VAGHARHHAPARHVQVPGAHPGKHGDSLLDLTSLLRHFDAVRSLFW